MSKTLLAGAVCFTASLLSVLVYASCADKKVRANSPCRTSTASCATYNTYTFANGTTTMYVSGCGTIQEGTFPGAFQCDLQSTGDYCHGNFAFAPCVTTFGCNGSVIGRVDPSNQTSPAVYQCVTVGQGQS
jgi:hypothetical protein